MTSSPCHDLDHPERPLEADDNRDVHPRHDVIAYPSKLVFRPDEVLNREDAGGKAYALARLNHVCAEIPAWFVISPAAFDASLTPAQKQLFHTVGCPAELLESLKPSEQIGSQILQALNEIALPDEQVAIRSSAVEEDSATASFAGQLESFLCVSRGDVLQRVADVWRSGFSERVRVYRQRKGLKGEPHPPAVLVQKMVSAEVSGIAFSSDPVSLESEQCVVSATAGYGDQLVGGRVQGDVYRVSRAGEVVETLESAEDARLQIWQVRQVAELARRLETFFGCPQDIEWAFASGHLYLLQSRPITTLRHKLSTSDITVWDNSNIVESYSGVTTPLTFSFARRVYAGVYRQFLLNLGVAPHTVRQNDEIFHHMLGYLRGRVYYNLLNWYRLLAMLPGVKHNRRFLDVMLGVRESLSTEVEQQLTKLTTRPKGRVRSLLAVGRLTTRIVWNWLTLTRRIDKFYQRLEVALPVSADGFKKMRLDELARHYRAVEERLLNRWDAPVLNDFYCMIFFGLSRQSLRRWSGPDAEALHGEFLQRKEGIVSTEPAQCILNMASIAAEDERLLESLRVGSREECESAIAANPAFRDAFKAYLDRFGDRCLEELKLESVTTSDDPKTLLRAIAYRAMKPATVEPPRRAIEPSQELRRLMPNKPLRRALTRWLIEEATRRVRNRENLRFERTRVFGYARRIFLQIGQELVNAGRLSNARDVLFLDVDELLAAIEGVGTTSNLAALAKLRISENEAFRSMPDLPTRFETCGAIVTALDHVQASGTQDTLPTDDVERVGIACSPGVVTGIARVIVDPQNAVVRSGDILVAKHTDPGWVLLFTTAAGVVVERGSLLSHSAIVAREMGIPAVVGVPGVTSWLRDGELIELDGAHGRIRRLSHVERT